MPLDLRASPSGPLIDIIDPDLEAVGRVLYVNGRTTAPLSQQTGSPLSPYRLLATAVSELSGTGGVIVIAPGDYTSEAPITLGSAAEWTLTNVSPHPNFVFGATGPSNVILPAVTGSSVSTAVAIIGCTLTAAVSSQRILLDSCWVNAIALSSAGLDAFDTRFIAGHSITLTAAGAFCALTDCELDSSNIICLGALTLRMTDCALFTALTMTSPATSSLRACGRTAFAFDAFVPTFTGTNFILEEIAVGSGRQIVNTTITGNAGTIDISSLQSGGAYVLQPPTANFNIDGFTAKQAGFWFDLVFDSAVSNLIGTLNYDVGAALTSMRTPQNAALHFTRNTTLRMRYQFNRWRVEVTGAGFGNVLPWLNTTVFDRAIPFVAYRAFAAGGGGAADDVTIVDAGNLTFPVRVLDAWLHTLTPVVGSTCHVRTATGGGGTGLTTNMASAVPGVTRNNDATTRNAVASDGLFLRRSDSGVGGDITLLMIRTG